MIDRHFQLFLWLQGEFQHFLPHDIFIAMVGNFDSGDIAIDVVSPLPRVRTGNCVKCGINSVADELYGRWRRNDYQLLTLAGGLGPLLGEEQCPCPMAPILSGAGTMLAHGLRDGRTGEDALYLLMHPGQVLQERQRNMFAMLLPQIDFACRRVVSTGDFVNANNPNLVQDFELTTREAEILEWVGLGKTNIDIGRTLNISAFTVKNHLQRIYRKMDVMNRAQAVAKLEELMRRRPASGR